MTVEQLKLEKLRLAVEYSKALIFPKSERVPNWIDRGPLPADHQPIETERSKEFRKQFDQVSRQLADAQA